MQQWVNEEGYMKTIYNLVRCVKLSENFDVKDNNFKDVTGDYLCGCFMFGSLHFEKCVKRY